MHQTLQNQLSVEKLLQNKQWCSQFDKYQLKEIRRGLEQNLNVLISAKPYFNYKQMAIINMGLKANIDTSIYAKKEYNDHQMYKIFLGLYNALDVSSLENPKLTHSQVDKAYSKMAKFMQPKNLAYYILDYCDQKNYTMNNLKLQNILFLLNKIFIYNKLGVCFQEHISVTAFGPIVHEVYSEFKAFGSGTVWNQPKPDMQKIYHQEELNQILDYLAPLNNTQVQNLVFSDPIWIEAKTANDLIIERGLFLKHQKQHVCHKSDT